MGARSDPVSDRHAEMTGAGVSVSRPTTAAGATRPFSTSTTGRRHATTSCGEMATDTTLTQTVQHGILNYMVQQRRLDNVFHALSDPTRRSILETLGRGTATVTELSEPFEISLTAIKKHLHVLEQAGLVTTEKLGRSRHCRLGTERLDDAMAWISFYQRLWEHRLDGLDAYLTLQKGITDD